MKKAYLIITVATIVVAAVLLFTSPMKETFQTNNEMYKQDNPCEYQLVIEDDSIIISDYGRHVATIHIDSAGNVGTELIKDNE
jgi:cell division protein FtsL